MLRHNRKFYPFGKINAGVVCLSNLSLREAEHTFPTVEMEKNTTTKQGNNCDMSEPINVVATNGEDLLESEESRPYELALKLAVSKTNFAK